MNTTQSDGLRRGGVCCGNVCQGNVCRRSGCQRQDSVRPSGQGVFALLLAGALLLLGCHTSTTSDPDAEASSQANTQAAVQTGAQSTDQSADALSEDGTPSADDTQPPQPLTQQEAIDRAIRTIEQRESWTVRGWHRDAVVVACANEQYWCVIVVPNESRRSANVAICFDLHGEVMSYQKGW